jgi:hypothetical protein
MLDSSKDRPPQSSTEKIVAKAPPRELRTVTRNVHMFEPAVPGRPAVPWTEGLDPDLVREHWPCWDDELPNPASIYAWDRKLVIYGKSKPTIRLVILFADPNPDTGRQRVVKYMLEWDPKTEIMAIKKNMKKLLDEFCKIEVRGRPRGTGHPKRMLGLEMADHELQLQQLRKIGLVERDIRILYARLTGHSFAQIARELKITPQAVHKRFNSRVCPKVRMLGQNRAKELLLVAPHKPTE